LRARGGFVIDLKWENGFLQKATVHSEKGRRGKVVYKESEKEIDLAAGKKMDLKF
jgi:hypothetical protein